MDKTAYLLQKLGEALYTHSKQACIANDAGAAVDYLREKIFRESSDSKNIK